MFSGLRSTGPTRNGPPPPEIPTFSKKNKNPNPLSLRFASRLHCASSPPRHRAPLSALIPRRVYCHTALHPTPRMLHLAAPHPTHAPCPIPAPMHRASRPTAERRAPSPTVSTWCRGAAAPPFPTRRSWLLRRRRRCDSRPQFATSEIQSGQTRPGAGADDRCHVVPPSSGAGCPEPTIPHSTLRHPKEG